MRKFNDPEVAAIFKSYPANIRKKLMFLRQLIFDTEIEMENVNKVQETLKWGEPSYISKGGSTIRLDWKKDSLDGYAMYFHCKTKLVDTFKELYRHQFTFEGNRAIIFNENDEIPINELKHCILLSLTYHHRKNLPMLGA